MSQYTFLSYGFVEFNPVNFTIEFGDSYIDPILLPRTNTLCPRLLLLLEPMCTT